MTFEQQSTVNRHVKKASNHETLEHYGKLHTIRLAEEVVKCSESGCKHCSRKVHLIYSPSQQGEQARTCPSCKKKCLVRREPYHNLEGIVQVWTCEWCYYEEKEI